MWIIILSGCISVTLVMSLVFCLCWRKKTPRDDWQGLDGMVIQKNPDENVNHLPSVAICDIDGKNNVNGQNCVNIRNSVTTTTKRSLPDIPAEQVAVVSWEPAGDNSSEHYATVGQYANKKNNALETNLNLPQYNSINRIEEKPYERVRYDKIQPTEEHPYAQLQPSSSRSAVHEDAQGTTEERATLLSLAEGVTTNETTHTSSRSRRSSAHSSGGLDIPAASAVAGVLAASPELPYMTPPVTQSNFSGDSQDSSKGYTSISVREPLSEIIAQTKEMNKKKRELDPHYSTVSDDSDDVYTTIADPNNPIYTSESETYAQISSLPITVEVEVNQPPSSAQQDVQTIDERYEPPPQPLPPSVDSLKHVTAHNGPTYSHSRQASSSSSIANLGSPKPEKRQANSPLPPPPVISNFGFDADHVHAVKNLDDLYAKVQKNKKSDSSPDGLIESLTRTSDRRSLSGISITSNKSASCSKPPPEEHNYETLKKTSIRRTSDPGYEKIKNLDEPGYASINGPESIPSSDPGYEVLKNRPPLNLGDSNYEQLRHSVSNASDSSEYTRMKDLNDGYSVVNKLRKRQSNLSTFIDTIDEPNYESMRSESSDTTAKASNSSESDPNYESVCQHNDPNYESVKDMEDPPYERLDEDSSRTNSEVSKSQPNKGKSESSSSLGISQSDQTDPPYEQLNTDKDSDIPGYEKITLKSINNTNSNNSGSSENSVPNIDVLEEDNIVQV